MALDIIENEGTSEKGNSVEIEDGGFSVHFGLGFQENSIYTWHLCFSSYYKMVQSLGIQKLVSKIEGIWTTSDKQWKVQKVETWWTFVQKNTFLQLKHYIQWIYLTLLSITCV